MGIYDREYYRGEGSGFLSSFTDRGKVCKYLILANIVLFVLQLVTLESDPETGRRGLGVISDWLALNSHEVLRGQVWRLLTYAFLHDPYNLFHILFNMLFLWWFGTDVEDLYGPREFLAVYLVSAVLGGIGFVLTAVAFPMLGGFCVGASGAVMAVMVLCALHFPNRTILLFFFLPVPIWAFVLFEVGFNTYEMYQSMVSHAPMSGTAVSVHLAGAAFAYLYYKRHWRLLDLWAKVRSWQRSRSQPRLRVYREEPERTTVPAAASVAPPVAHEVDEHLEAKLDAVLEKVARSGRDSLTESERQILHRASEIYRRRRS